MQAKKDRFGAKDIIALTVLFSIGFFISTLPIHDNPMPFGEGDAAHQYGKADYYYSSDRIFLNSPFHIYMVWYSGFNAYSRDPNDHSGFLYPPFYFTDGALVQAFTGERILGLNIYIAIMSILLAAFSTYFFMRKLFGFYPAVLSSFMILFAYRSIMGYIWGQRAILVALAFLPLALYYYYMYARSYLNKEPKPLYLIIMVVLASTMALFHAMIFVVMFFIIFVYTVILIVKYRKLPFDIKLGLLAILIFLVIFAPFGYQILQGRVGKSQEFKIQNIGTLFKWYDATGKDNPQLYVYKNAYGGYWTVPLLALGLLFIVLRRKDDKSLLLISWLIALYLVFHFPVLNQTQFSMDRLIKAEAYIFYPLIALGLLSIPLFFKMPRNIRTYLKLGLSILFIIIFVFTVAKPFSATLKDSYKGILRITPAQYELAEWVDANLEPDDVAILMGTLTYGKEKYIHVLSHRALRNTMFYLQEPGKYDAALAKTEKRLANYTQGRKTSIDYAIFDYSDLQYLRDNPQFQPFFSAMQEFKDAHGIGPDAVPLYNQNNIFVFKLNNNRSAGE